MSFLGGLFLVALPLIGVPIALHFYKGRQVDVVDWGAMHFLLDAVSDGRRWEKLEELLLMLLRVAAVAALVFALARPQLPGSWIGVHDRREVVLVIDDSLSTATEIGDGDRTVFDLIKKQALDSVDELKASDQVQVLAASAGGRWLTAEPIAANSAGKRRLNDIVESLKATGGHASLLENLHAARGLERLEGVEERLILFVTDAQSEAFDSDNKEAWAAWGNAREQDHTTVRVLECGLGEAAPGNLAIGDVNASRTVVHEGEEVTLSCEIANFGQKTTKPSTVKWTSGEEVVAKARLGSVAPGERSQSVVTTRLKGAGTKLLVCSLQEDDRLPQDQSASIVIEVASRTPVLIVESTSPDDPDDWLPASKHLAAALGFLDGKPQSWRSTFEPKIVAPEDFFEVDLSTYPVVILTDPDPLDEEDVDRLRGFVAVGGGLWVALGPTLQAERFTSLWHDGGEGLCPLPVGGLAASGLDADDFRGEELDLDQGVQIHPPDGDHPATATLANTTQLDIDKTRISRFWRFREPDKDADFVSAAEETSVLLRSGDGDLLVIERYFGRGRVILQSFPLDLQWSDLPVRKSYVPLVQDWLEYLATPSQNRFNLSPGAPIVTRPPEVDAVAIARVVTPSGAEVPLSPRGDLVTPVVRYSQTRLPGPYRVQFEAADQTIQETIYQVPRELSESRLDPLDESARTLLTETAGIRFAAGESELATAPESASPMSPFWWTLLAVLTGLLVFELVMATRVSRRRMGEPE